MLQKVIQDKGNSNYSALIIDLDDFKTINYVFSYEFDNKVNLTASIRICINVNDGNVFNAILNADIALNYSKKQEKKILK